MYWRIKTRITFFELDGTAPKVISRFTRMNLQLIFGDLSYKVRSYYAKVKGKVDFHSLYLKNMNMNRINQSLLIKKLRLTLEFRKLKVYILIRK